GSGYEMYGRELETGDEHSLGPGSSAVYSPTGHVLFWRSGGLWAMPVARDTLQPAGGPSLLGERAGSPSVSEDGTLVYVDLRGWWKHRLVWRDRDGNMLGAFGQPQTKLKGLSLSPSSDRVAAGGWDGESSHVWIHETERRVASRLTEGDTSNSYPIFSPSGRRVLLNRATGHNYD
ncbi:MAG: hypothetical protein GY953_50695, partial [bacterium]|nr:hypothetical protein [bacterium]